MIDFNFFLSLPSRLFWLFAHYSVRLFNWLIKYFHAKCYFILFVFFGFCALPAWSDTAKSADYGAYSGIRLGYSYNNHSCVDIAIVCDREDAGYGIFAGYDFNDYFSFEISATKLGDTYAIYPNVTLNGELSTVDISAKYTHTLHRKIQAFGKLGIAYWDGEITGWGNTLKDSGARPTVGAGIQMPFSEHVNGRLEYQYFDQLGNSWMGYTDSHLISVALVWNFSAAK